MLWKRPCMSVLFITVATSTQHVSGTRYTVCKYWLNKNKFWVWKKDANEIGLNSEAMCLER